MQNATQYKQQYLAQIRASSAYEPYRGGVGVVAALGYLLAIIPVIGGFIGCVIMMSARQPALGVIALIASGVVAVIMLIGIQFWRQAAMMLADIADLIADSRVQ